MPVVTIEFDGKKVSRKEAHSISNAVQKVVHSATRIEDVSVFANSSSIKVKAAPIEVFVYMSDYKIKNAETLAKEFRRRLSSWKKDSKFRHRINLTLIPMNWKVEKDI
jgi:hypothetical protein